MGSRVEADMRRSGESPTAVLVCVSLADALRVTSDKAPRNQLKSTRLPKFKVLKNGGKKERK